MPGVHLAVLQQTAGFVHEVGAARDLRAADDARPPGLPVVLRAVPRAGRLVGLAEADERVGESHLRAQDEVAAAADVQAARLGARHGRDGGLQQGRPAGRVEVAVAREQREGGVHGAPDGLARGARRELPSAREVREATRGAPLGLLTQHPFVREAQQVVRGARLTGQVRHADGGAHAVEAARAGPFERLEDEVADVRLVRKASSAPTVVRTGAVRSFCLVR